MNIQSKRITNWKEGLGLCNMILEEIWDHAKAPNMYEQWDKPFITIMGARGVILTNNRYMYLGECVDNHILLMLPLMLDH